MHEYKGFYYMVDAEFLEDNTKHYHLAINGFNQSYMMPVSPYMSQPIPEEYFKMWIDMDMPSKEQIGGTAPKQFIEYYRRWITEQLEKELGLI